MDKRRGRKIAHEQKETINWVDHSCSDGGSNRQKKQPTDV